MNAAGCALKWSTAVCAKQQDVKWDKTNFRLSLTCPARSHQFGYGHNRERRGNQLACRPTLDVKVVAATAPLTVAGSVTRCKNAGVFLSRARQQAAMSLRDIGARENTGTYAFQRSGLCLFLATYRPIDPLSAFYATVYKLSYAPWQARI
jgi:hypothetical protein